MSTTPRQPSALPTDAAGFRTTHWTLVLEAGQSDGDAARDALASLCSRYWYPLYAFVRRQRRTPHEAEDLTQGFFAHLLEKESLRRVRPEAGKFRSFLLACLKNYMFNEHERLQAQRRGGGQALLTLDGGEFETRYTLEPADKLTPEAAYDRRWAWMAIEEALAALKREYATPEKQELFEHLQAFLPGGRGSESRAELAARRGVSVGAIDVAIHRLRQRFRALLREAVAATVASPEEVDDEIRYLIAAAAT